ncbi:M1 family metallopeptidase [soil metagenome]
MRCLLLGVVSVSWLAACGSDPGPTGAISAHVTHYDYKLDLDTRIAHSKVTLVADSAGDCMTLPFRATDLTGVAFDGAPASGTQNADQTLTVCGNSVAKDATFTLESDHSIALATLSTSNVGFSITKDKEQNSFTYLVSWVDGCDQFGPCDNRPDQFATYTFDVTHTAAVMVRCSGTVTDKSPTETLCDFQDAGGPTYSTFGLAAYPAWTQTDKGTWSGVHVTVYDRAATGVAAAIDPTFHAGFLTWMQAQFGAFPFGTELRVLTAPTYWSGFEHPGNIVLDDGLAKEVGGYLHPVAHVLDHEMTHMWAGDQTTLAATYDFVWKEAMAEYLAFVWEDMNDAASSTATTSLWKADSKVAKYFPVPQEHPALFDYYGDVYGPGPMVLFRQLEVLTSREQGIAALMTVLGTPHALSVDELVTALEASTELQLGDYAAAWIKGSGAPQWPRVATSFTPGATTGAVGSLAVAVTNNPPGTPRGCKFHVTLSDGGANSVKVEVNTFANGPVQSLAVAQPAFTVTKIDLDPDHECLVFPATGVAKTVLTGAHPWVSSTHSHGE